MEKELIDLGKVKKKIKNKKFLVLGGSISQYPLVKKLRSLNYYVGLVDPDPKCVCKDLTNKFYKINIGEINKVKNIFLKKRYDRILTIGSDFTNLIKSKLNQELNLEDLYCPKFSEVEKFSNKSKFRKLLESLKLPCPKNITITKKKGGNYHQAKSFLKKHKNIISKPIDSSGSKGVTKINELDDINKKLNFSFNFSQKKKVILEEFLETDSMQICGDGIICKGKIIYFFPGYGISYEDSFIPLAEAFPYNNQKIIKKIIKQIEFLISKTKIKNTFFNIDIILKQKKIFIIEFAPRLGGNFICEAITNSSGIDLLNYEIFQKYPQKKKINKVKYILNGMLHSNSKKKFKNFKIKKEIIKFLISKKILVKKNQMLDFYKNQSKTYGNIILIFKSKKVWTKHINISPKLFEI